MCSTPIHLNKQCLISLFIFYAFQVIGQYQTFRGSEFDATLNFYADHKNEFQQASKGTRLNSKQIFSIVAPEICEYNSIGDFFESNSLKVLYVQNGATYADFSIGYFQMKPSFIEKLEQEIKSDFKLKLKFKHLLISENDPKTKRRERIRRLEDLNWQLKYLQLFALVFEKKMKKMNIVPDNEFNELKFYSTAYNSGFFKHKSELENEMNKNRFPRASNKKFNYSRVCLEFYKAL